MNTVANRIIEITPNGIIDRLMTFDDYIRSKEIRAQREELYLAVGVQLRSIYVQEFRGLEGLGEQAPVYIAFGVLGL